MKKVSFFEGKFVYLVYEGSFERNNSQQSKCDAG